MFKRIALISEQPAPLTALVAASGGHLSIANLAQQLARLGYAVDVLTRQEDAQSENVSWDNRVRIVALRAGPALPLPQQDLLEHLDEFTTSVVNFIRRDGKFDVMYANTCMSGIVAAFVRTMFQVPFVLPFRALAPMALPHQLPDDEFIETRLKIQQWVVDQADQIIVQGLADKQTVMRSYHAAPGKILILPQGFDGNQFYRVEKEIARNQLRPFRTRDHGAPWRPTPAPFPHRAARP